MAIFGLENIPPFVIVIVLTVILLIVIVLFSGSSKSVQTANTSPNFISWSSNGLSNNSYTVKYPSGATTNTSSTYLNIDSDEYTGGQNYDFIVTDINGDIQTVVYSSPVKPSLLTTERGDTPLLSWDSNNSMVSKYLLSVKNSEDEYLVTDLELSPTLSSYSLNGINLVQDTTITFLLTSIGENGTRATSSILYLVQYEKPQPPNFGNPIFVDDGYGGLGIQMGYNTSETYLGYKFTLSSKPNDPLTSTTNPGFVTFTGVPLGSAYVSGQSENSHLSSDVGVSGVFDVPGNPIPPLLESLIVNDATATVSVSVSTLDPEYERINSIVVTAVYDTNASIVSGNLYASNSVPSLVKTISRTTGTITSNNSVDFIFEYAGTYNITARSFSIGRVSEKSNTVTVTI